MRAVEKLLTSKRLLSHISRDYSPIAMYQTFCPEDMVLAHLIFSDLVHSEYKNIHMFTIDTGRTSDEIYQAIESMQRRYGKVITVYHPDAEELAKFDADFGFGENYYHRSCEIRFINPLKRVLTGHNAWISTSSPLQPLNCGNSNLDKAWISWDKEHHIPRFNPVARWSNEELRNYARHHGLSLIETVERPRVRTTQTDSSESYPAAAVGIN